MAPQVNKVRSAFLFYQTEQLKNVRDELGLGMGEAMTELARRWRLLNPEAKMRYEGMEEQDRVRYERESAEADEAAAAEVERRLQNRTVQEGESHASRGARAKIDQEREEKQRRQQQRREEALEALDPEERAAREEAAAAKRAETEQRRKEKKKEQQEVARQHKKLDKEESKKAAQRLEYLLKQSSVFAKLQGAGKGHAHAHGDAAAAAAAASVHHIHTEESNEEEEEEEEEDHVFLSKQPSCIKFGQMKPYQLEALNWMIHLSEKGLNGILADEMGLGKTLQSISILAYHYEYRRIQGPHLICVPKSTLSNWMNELNRWCPSLRVIKFHGHREEREYMIDNFFTPAAAAHDGRRPDRQIMNEKGELVDDNTDTPRTWDVCVTTYEVANHERKVLQRFAWKYLVIDEAHRLKNDASMFSSTVRSFRTANRLLLTGTPLQNNLHELWALLNFLLPDIFASAEQFDEWFNLEIDDEEAKKNMISQLHKILRPFMLRRLKADVAKGLPPKTETILYVGMSRTQKQLYKKLLLRDLDSITGKASGKNRTAILNIVMQLRKCCGHPYLFEGIEDRKLDPLGEHLVENCGKLSMVDKLLKRLNERGSRVLIFTQMTRILDILEDFMVMRGYKYCRIDGNTNYEDREANIDDFNRPGSDKFCFILSTRAGGLGINLQTADTCILYDSDWNPQQDLQAQDRCHRLGQKKPVNVFRLVTENTVEEKIVERAQQKLKLDAMVVQQGRLKEKDKVSKEEIMAAVRFGADAIFRSEESTITDDDIDAILQRGEAKTKELAEKIQKAEKGDLLDFRLDGGISAQTFEGIDYSDKDLRDHLRMLAADSMGKRERRPPPKDYQPIIQSKKSMVVGNRRIKLPKCLRIPQMEDHHFYNRERLLELGKLEFETYAALREAGQLPPREVMERQRTLLPAELGQEKLELLAEGFGSWSRSQYFHFVKACAKYGRDDIAAIAAEMDMPEEAVAPYSEAFWRYGPTELKDDWERVIGTIERGEKKIAKQKKLSGLLNQFVETFTDPRHEMVFANKGTTHFALEQDRALLTAVNKHGYGNWDSVREEIRRDSGLRFQHAVQGMTAQSIAKRCDYRMRQMERELEAREKSLKMKRPPNVVAAHKAIEAIKEMDFWDMQVREAQLDGEDPPTRAGLSSEALLIMDERLRDRAGAVARLREIEVQVQRCMKVADDTKKCIYRGDQYVNYSTITLKSGGPAVADKDENTGITLKESVDIEAKINEEVLKVPTCRQCEACTSSNTKLCVRRLEVRNQVMDREVKKFTDRDSPKKKSKKRKADDPLSPMREGGKPLSSSKPTSSSGAATASAGGGGGTKSSSAAASTAAAASSSNSVAKDGADDVKPRPRVTSQGNKKMSIPEELFPEFIRRLTAQGTWEREKFAKDFAADHPTVSMRQVSMKLSEVTTRDRPPCVEEPAKRAGTRAITFYLRPRYYKYLPDDDRPPDWERYAVADEALALTEPPKKAPAGAASSTANAGDPNGGSSSDVAVPPPPSKKAKVQGVAAAGKATTAAAS